VIFFDLLLFHTAILSIAVFTAAFATGVVGFASGVVAAGS
jgi:hypothetical protein